MAWDERLSKSSGTVHNAMRYRAAIEHDPAVIEAMARKAELVDEAVAALRAGHRERLGPIMDRDFDLRRSVYDLPADQVRMIDIARRHGSHAKFAGSGGAHRHVRSTWPGHRRLRGGRHLRGARARGDPTSLDHPTRMKPDAGPLPHGDGNRFSFGKNWSRFLTSLSEQQIAHAEHDIAQMLGTRDLSDKTFLDIGSGVAARRLGARVHSFDFDPLSGTTQLKARYYPDDSSWN